MRFSGFFLPVLLSAAALGASGCAGASRLYLNPSPAVYADPSSEGIPHRTVTFRSGDGTALSGLFFPSLSAPLGTVVHMHGNSENLTKHFRNSAWLAKEGFNVFLFDYRGYGASAGRADLDGAVRDAEAALREVSRMPEVDAGRVIVFGQSLGGAIAVAAISESGLPLPAALVVEGTFSSYKRVGSATIRRNWLTWPVSWLPWILIKEKHPPLKGITGITCPKLFVHSENDPTVPYSEGRRLYEAAPEPKEFWDVPSGHIDAFHGQRDVYGPRLVSFLRKTLGAPGAAAR